MACLKTSLRRIRHCRRALTGRMTPNPGKPCATRCPANRIVRLRVKKRGSNLITQRTLGGGALMMTYEKQFDRIAGRLMMAALALVITLIPNAAFAQGQQEKGRRVNPNRPDSVQTETQTGQSVSGDQDRLIMNETSENGTKFSNPILDTRIIRFEVSENAKRFVFDETPLHEDGAPAYGNEFVTEGYIYTAGTLNGTNGVNPDGSPEFPERVIGRWTCRGWNVGEGAKTVSGPWVITHQLYDFGGKPGQVTIMTDGVELVDIGAPVKRALIGGTGPYAEARGEATQTMIGFNQINGVNLRYEVRVVIRN